MPRLSPDRTLPTAITQLRLGSALKHCGTTSVEDAFDKSIARSLYIYDRLEEKYSDWTDCRPANAAKYFRADNPDGLTLVLLPLDNRTITGRSITHHGICDCMVLTEKEVSFIEFKTNVESTSYLNLLDKANNAINQLWHTYDGIIRPKCCQALKRETLPIPVDFHVVFDKDLCVTGISAELMDMQNVFLEQHQLPLFFDNDKTFR